MQQQARVSAGSPEPTVTLQLLHNKRGPATLVLELSAPLTAVGSDKAAGFGLIPAPSALLRVTVPDGKYLLLDGLAVERPEPAQPPQAVGDAPPLYGERNVLCHASFFVVQASSLGNF